MSRRPLPARNRAAVLGGLVLLAAACLGCRDVGTGGPGGPKDADPGACRADDSAAAQAPAPTDSSARDSSAWRRALCHAPFPGRMRANLTAFGDRLWLLGGADAGGLRFDAWSTADGIVWRRETDSLPFAPAVDFKVVVHRESLWALTTRTVGEEYANDVWASADGAAWTRVAADVAAFRWGGNRESAFAAYGDRLWIVWGAPLVGYGESAISSSADGRAWRSAPGAPLSGGLKRAGAASHAGALWILGGDGMPDAAFYSDLTWRTDGTEWAEVPSDTGVLPRFDFALAAHAGRLWVAGGVATAAPYAPDGARADEVWSSADGRQWALADAHAPFGKRAGAASAAFRGRLWVVGGYRLVDGQAAPGFLDDVWYREEAP